MSVNYVVTTWGGPRREWNFCPFKILARHIYNFSKVKKSVSKSSIVVAIDKSVKCAGEFESFCAAFADVGDIGCVLTHTNDDGWSYGSFVRSWNYYKDSGSKYYIFIEDDYSFVTDDFDKILVSAIESCDDDVGYLAAAIDKTRWPEHASCSVGIIKADALRAAELKFGFVPYLPWHFGDDGKDMKWPQVAFAQGLIRAGYRIESFEKFGWAAPFWRSGDKRLVHLNDSRDILYFPIQAM